MRLKLENPRLLSDIIGIISELVTEVKLKVSSEGMSLTAVDPANVAMVYFKLPSDLFSEFNISKDETLGLNLDNLKAVLRRCKPGSSLSLEKADNFLKLSIQDRIKRDFSLALIDIESDDKELPSWEFESVIKMDSNALLEVIEDCSVVSDACTFVSEPSKFVVEASGLNSAKAEFSSDEIEIHSGNSSARYSLEYLNKFIKGAKIAARATINFSSNHPLRLNFPTGNVMLSFVLAPRIEQDD
jgi:proliferating cell nuclear antigen